MFGPARYVVEGVESVGFGLLCPALTNPLKRVEPAGLLRRFAKLYAARKVTPCARRLSWGS